MSDETENTSLVGRTPIEIINSTRERVAEYLADSYPDFSQFEDNTFAISKGSTRVMVFVRGFSETECAVECVAHVVSGANVTPELMKFLLRKNAELHIGGFGLLFDDTIVFTHTIYGSNLDRNEMISAVTATAIISDHYDDEIVQMAGGKRSSDIMEL